MKSVNKTLRGTTKEQQLKNKAHVDTEKEQHEPNL